MFKKMSRLNAAGRASAITAGSSKTFNLVISALMVAVIAVLSQVAIPMPSGVPVTLQTFAVALCAYFLETKYSLLTVIVYILLGLVGVPVFANFGAGPGKLLGLTGGFIFGFILFAVLCSVSMKFKNVPLRIALGLAGLMACHLCGVLQFMFLSGNPFTTTFLMVSAPFLVKDVISVVLAYVLADRILPVLNKIKQR